ncbi:peptidase S41 [Nibribacter ruber]|uniref:Peptidase S41 n=1 Tax=Nibribacter ruber TaxID=2698458 RepID=A0A6P1P081_9BACT|nr:S41 family peptidase [Nibribacter ruber]QHL86713.1 peptidase S41 [Nibribacter ruber]
MKLKQWIVVALLLTAARISVAQEKGVMFSGSAVKADLEYLYHTLEDAHYNLYAYVSKSKYDKMYNTINQSIGKDSLSQLETIKLFQRLAAAGNVGHSEIDFPVQAYIAFARGGGALFPLELAFENGKSFIRKNHSSTPNAAVGDQVLSIDGQPIKKIQEAIHPYLSAERLYFKNAKLEFWSFPRLYWSVFGEKKSFNVTLKKTNGRTENLKIPALPVMEYETKRGGEILSIEPSFKYMGAAAYLNPGPFSSQEADGEARFKAFIDSAFADLNSKAVKNLVIDLRNNSGGHNAYSDHLISYFATKPFRWYSSFKLKTSKVLKEQTRKNTPEAKLDDYAKAILSHQDGEKFAYDQPFQNPAPEATRFKGNVYVLVNRQTYSMAAVSAALIQDYGFGKIVGEETADVPTLYASQFSFTLPKTGVTVKVPKGYIVRPNGNEALSGVKPDVMVRDHLLDDEDEILHHVLNTLLAPNSPLR